MEIRDFISEKYPFTRDYESIRSIEKRLIEKNYIVVVNGENEFCGILTSSDILIRPYENIIDCLTPKSIIRTSDSFTDVIGKFEQTPSEALPVFQNDVFIGIIEKTALIKKLITIICDLRNELKTSQVFLHNLSHEIRTPLNHILGFMSIIAELSPGEIEPNKEQYFGIIQDSSEQFLLVMDNLIKQANR